MAEQEVIHGLGDTGIMAGASNKPCGTLRDIELHPNLVRDWKQGKNEKRPS
jgi:hypothetical protein